MQTNLFLGTFAPGFESIIDSLLQQTLPSASIVRVCDGLVLFSYPGKISEVCAVAFFNNAFLVLQEWHTDGCSFSDMVRSSVTKSRLPVLSGVVRDLGAASFRVRFSRENVFASVDKKVMETAEKVVISGTGMRADRFSPEIEFWYIIRREKYACFAVRLTKKQSTEKYLNPGELRPEIVQLVIALAQIVQKDGILADPFAGYGSIPGQLARLYPRSRIYASDIGEAMVVGFRKRFAEIGTVEVRQCDALHLSYIDDSSVDAVVTDPPWGFWDGDAYSGVNDIGSLYRGMLAEFDRILKSGGKACVLTGAKREFEEAVGTSPIFAHCIAQEGFRTDILVNGKKCAVFRLSRKA